jgi:hypothetical protein
MDLRGCAFFFFRDMNGTHNNKLLASVQEEGQGTEISVPRSNFYLICEAMISANGGRQLRIKCTA